MKTEIKKFTVLLLYPDYLAENYGEATYLAQVEAIDLFDAVERAQEMAVEANKEDEDDFIDGGDFRSLLVIEDWPKCW